MQIEMISVKEWYRKTYEVSRVRTDFVKNWLDTLGAQDDRFTYLIAGNDFFVKGEEQIALLKDYIDSTRQPHHAPAADSGEPIDLALFENRIDQLETLVLEQDGRIDQLHKAVQQIALLYEAIRAATSDPRKLPDAPKLPPRYKWRILVVGGDYRVLERMEPKFHNIKFLHVESAGAAGNVKGLASKTTWPRADAVMVMTSWTGHSMAQSAQANYDKSIITMISGSISSLEAAVQVWVANKERETEAQERLK